MTKTVLLGTTNPAKIKRFEELLRGYAVRFYTLSDLHIEKEPRETGTTPWKNAELKAKFYGQYFDLVICSDSGLYFDGLPAGGSPPARAAYPDAAGRAIGR